MTVHFIIFELTVYSPFRISATMQASSVCGVKLPMRKHIGVRVPFNKEASSRRSTQLGAAIPTLGTRPTLIAAPTMWLAICDIMTVELTLHSPVLPTWPATQGNESYFLHHGWKIWLLWLRSPQRGPFTAVGALS